MTKCVRLSLVLALLALACCAADIGDESIDSTQERAVRQPTPPDGGTEPVEIGRTRTSWKDLAESKAPKWEVYSLPYGGMRDAPILAIPKDGRGVPIVLAFWHYHYEGDTYFAKMLRSGYVSIFDLKIIMGEIRKYPNGTPPLMKAEPPGTVDPAMQAWAWPNTHRRRGLEEGEGGGLVSYPGDVEDLNGTEGPPTVVSTPTGAGGAPVYHCGGAGGAPVSSPNGCADYDPRKSGGTKLADAFRNLLASSKGGLQVMFGSERGCNIALITPLTVNTALAVGCKVPVLRVVPETAIPCAVIDVGFYGTGLLAAWASVMCHDLFTEM